MATQKRRRYIYIDLEGARPAKALAQAIAVLKLLRRPDGVGSKVNAIFVKGSVRTVPEADVVEARAIDLQLPDEDGPPTEYEIGLAAFYRAIEIVNAEMEIGLSRFQLETRSDGQRSSWDATFIYGTGGQATLSSSGDPTATGSFQFIGMLNDGAGLKTPIIQTRVPRDYLYYDKDGNKTTEVTDQPVLGDDGNHQFTNQPFLADVFDVTTAHIIANDQNVKQPLLYVEGTGNIYENSRFLQLVMARLKMATNAITAGNSSQDVVTTIARIPKGQVQAFGKGTYRMAFPTVNSAPAESAASQLLGEIFQIWHGSKRAQKDCDDLRELAGIAW